MKEKTLIIMEKSARSVDTFSSHALRANLSALRTRDSIVALRTWFYILCINSSLFLVIRY